MVITSHQSHICPHCQCDSGHWFYHNFLRNFAPNLSNLMMHHIIPYQILQNPHVLNWFFRRRQMQYHSFTGHSRILFHEQLKLAGAARGLPGDHGPPKSSFILSYQYNLPPHSKTSGHEPCRASRNCSHQCLRSQSSIQRRLQNCNSQRRTDRQQYGQWLSQRLRWMGSTLPIPIGSAYKVQVSSEAQRRHYPPHFLQPTSRSRTNCFKTYILRDRPDDPPARLDNFATDSRQLRLECGDFYRFWQICPIPRNSSHITSRYLLSSGH